MKKYGRDLSKEHKTTMYYVRHISRILMGLLFIFSGYVKMVDPYGFALKIEEYFISFGMDFMTPSSMFFSFLAVGAEFILGWALLFGIQMQLAAWGLLAFMVFFTLLTFWLAYALDIVDLVNRLFGTGFEVFVVTDCGCFGDFVKLDNYQTFYKNIIFLFFTLIIFAQRKKYKTTKWYYITQWLPMVMVGGFALFTMLYCLRHEPWHDFRPWKVGNYIAGETYSQAPEVDFVFQYKNNINASIMDISMEELIEISDDSIRSADLENNYTFIGRTEKIIKPAIYAQLADFSMTDRETNEDIKNEVILSNDYTFIIFMRDVAEITPERFEPVKTFMEACDARNLAYYVLTGSLKEEADDFNAANNADIHFYYSDITPLKTAVRNNPGIVLIKDGYVLDKWAFLDIPPVEKVTASLRKYERQLEKYKVKNPPIVFEEDVVIEGKTVENDTIVEPNQDINIE
ncbi:MAG: DoxX family protein [Bacteroidales bacterium]|jgi:uncharacterized membrane protein YphA (DoxX/SURF4 family)|nr:DoxX family protein [Bacteroidales bacterium]